LVGLGRYLVTLDDTQTWQNHLQYIMIFCLVHYNRNIQHFRDHQAYSLMKNLPFLHDSSHVLTILDQLAIDPDRKVAAWAKDKQTSWVLSGINQSFSKMNSETFRSIQRNTNNIESIQRQTKTTGRDLSLANGIVQ
jgi:hypothetical protein